MKVSNEKLFFLSYGIYMLFSILSTSFYFQYFSRFYSLIVVLCILILIFSESVKCHFRIREIWGISISIILFLIMFRVTSVSAAVIIYVYCARDIDFKKIADFTIKISSATLLLIIVSSYLGVITSFSNIQSDGRNRQYLGFLYALCPGTIMFNISALFIYLKHKDFKWKYIVLLFITNYWLFTKTVSRTNFCLSLILIFYMIIYKNKGRILKNKLFRWAQTLSFLISAIVSVSITVLYSPGIKWMNLLNQFLGNRLYFGQESVNKYGIKFFGQEIDWVGSGLNTFGETSTEAYSWVDCLYVQILQRYGWIFMVLFILVALLAMRRLNQRDETILLFIISLVAYRSMIDDLSLFLYCNTFWIPLGTVLMHNNFYKKRVKSRELSRCLCNEN